MIIREKIQQEMIGALKTGDKPRLETVRYLFSQIKNREIDLKRPLADDEAVKLLQTEAKRRKEAIEAYQKGGRQDLVEKESYQLAVINEYLPKQLSNEELKTIIAEIKSANPSGDFGMLMKATMAKVAGKADGSRVAALCR